MDDDVVIRNEENDGCLIQFWAQTMKLKLTGQLSNSWR
jgi:hypothetical protein